MPKKNDNGADTKDASQWMFLMNGRLWHGKFQVIFYGLCWFLMLSLTRSVDFTQSLRVQRKSRPKNRSVPLNPAVFGGDPHTS